MNVLLMLLTPLFTLVLHSGTGLVILRSAKLNPVEKLLASVAISGIIVYLAGFAGYLLHHPRSISIALLIASAICLLFNIGSIRSLLRNHQVRRVVVASGWLILWMLVLVSVIRSYNGALWYGDWYEHYERTQMFARTGHVDLHTGFLDGMYTLPARPPFQNIVTAVAIAPADTRFDAFAYAMTTLNALIAPAGMLLLATVAPRGRRAIYVYATLLALSPMFVQNVTFTWTKLYAGFYALTGLYFYLRAYSRSNLLHLTLSALCFAAGAMVHYSIVPYVLILAIPYLFKLLKGGRIRYRHTIIAAASAVVLISTWVSFSFYHFGIAGTISTNTAVQDAAKLTFNENLFKMASNVGNTIFPTWAEDSRLPRQGVGYWRDRFFVLYQTTLPFMLGSAGFWIWISRRFWRCAKPSPSFWMFYVAGVTVLGIAVHGSPAMFSGLANVALTPLVVHGIGWVAVVLTRIRESFWLSLIAAGYLLDAAMGIVAHLYLESYFLDMRIVGIRAEWTRDPNMTDTAFFNLMQKELWGLTFPYDHWPSMRWPLLFGISLTLCILVARVTFYRNALDRHARPARHLRH